MLTTFCWPTLVFLSWKRNCLLAVTQQTLKLSIYTSYFSGPICWLTSERSSTNALNQSQGKPEQFGVAQVPQVLICVERWWVSACKLLGVAMEEAIAPSAAHQSQGWNRCSWWVIASLKWRLEERLSLELQGFSMSHLCQDAQYQDILICPQGSRFWLIPSLDRGLTKCPLDTEFVKGLTWPGMVSGSLRDRGRSQIYSSKIHELFPAWGRALGWPWLLHMPPRSVPRVYNSGMIFLSITMFDTACIHSAFADRNVIDLICPLCHLDYRPGKQSSSCVWMMLFLQHWCLTLFIISTLLCFQKSSCRCPTLMSSSQTWILLVLSWS